MASKIKKGLTGAFFVMAWACLFGELSKTLAQDSLFFEVIAVACGASLGFILALTNEYLIKQLSRK